MATKNVMLIEMLAENEDNSSKQYAADIYLPASIYEIDDAVDRCRGYLIKTNMMPLSISECESVPLLSELRFDTVTLYELNYLAKQISEFNNAQLAAYNALLPLVVGENYESELISIKDVINLTYNVDDYSVAVNVFNDTELGEMLIDNEMFDGIENLSDEMIEFLDAKKIGEAHRLNENGVYVNGCYISRESFELKEVFKGESLPDDAVDRYLFRLDISNPPIQNWITVPFSESTEKFLNATNATEFNLVDFESAIPLISKYSDEGYKRISLDELQRINEFAKKFIALDEIRSIKFKAALFYEGINTLDDIDKIESVLKNADSYNLKYFNVFSSDFAKDYLAKYLDDTFPKEYLELINTQALGDRLMDELHGKYTPYGVLLKGNIKQTLANESKHEFMLADFLSKHILFTEDRLKAEEIPEGLYKYEFRSGAEYTYATLEENEGIDESELIKMRFYFPLYAQMEFDEGKEPCNVDTDYILANMNEVETELQKYTSLDDINMVEYYDENSSIKDKLVSMDWEIREINDTPYGYVNVVLNAPLNDSEVDELKDWISGQNSDGLGEGFEQRRIETDDGSLFVSFWDSEKDYFIYTQEEMDEYIEQAGGMNLCQ